MEAAIARISGKGAHVEQPVPLVALAEVTKDSGVKEIEDIMSISTEYLPIWEES